MGIKSKRKNPSSCERKDYFINSGTGLKYDRLYGFRRGCDKYIEQMVFIH